MIIKNKAEEASLSVSEFLRRLAFDTTLKPRLTPEEIQHYYMLLEYATNFKNISNLFKLGDITGVKEESVKTARLIREHLKKFN